MKHIFFLSLLMLECRAENETEVAMPAQVSSETQTTFVVASDLFGEYIYKPLVIEYSQRSAMSLEIDKLTKLLQDKIIKHMAEFIELGKQAKEMQRTGATKRELHAQHSKMADIFYALRPAEPLVRSMYPKLNKMFDQLIELREQLDYCITGSDIVVNPDASNGWFTRVV